MPQASPVPGYVYVMRDGNAPSRASTPEKRCSSFAAWTQGLHVCNLEMRVPLDQLHGNKYKIQLTNRSPLNIGGRVKSALKTIEEGCSGRAGRNANEQILREVLARAAMAAPMSLRVTAHPSKLAHAHCSPVAPVSTTYQHTTA